MVLIGYPEQTRVKRKLCFFIFQMAVFMFRCSPLRSKFTVSVSSFVQTDWASDGNTCALWGVHLCSPQCTAVSRSYIAPPRKTTFSFQLTLWPLFFASSPLKRASDYVVFCFGFFSCVFKTIKNNNNNKNPRIKTTLQKTSTCTGCVKGTKSGGDIGATSGNGTLKRADERYPDLLSVNLDNPQWFRAHCWQRQSRWLPQSLPELDLVQKTPSEITADTHHLCLV